MDSTWSSPRGSNRTLKGSKETPALTGLIMDNILPTVISMPSQLNLDLIFKVNTNILVYVIWFCPGFLGPTWAYFARDSWDQLGLILPEILGTKLGLFWPGFLGPTWSDFGLGSLDHNLVWFFPGFLGPIWSDFALDSWDQLDLILPGILGTNLIWFCPGFLGPNWAYFARESWDQLVLIMLTLPREDQFSLLNIQRAADQSDKHFFLVKIIIDLNFSSFLEVACYFIKLSQVKIRLNNTRVQQEILGKLRFWRAGNGLFIYFEK